MNLAAAEDEHARLRPDAPALIDSALRLTHAELASAVQRTAVHLRTIGVDAEQLIGVALGDHAAHVVTMLALARIGAVMLPIDHRWTAIEQERVVSHFGARLILVESGTKINGAPNLAVDEHWQASVARITATAAGPIKRPAAALKPWRSGHGAQAAARWPSAVAPARHCAISRAHLGRTAAKWRALTWP